MLNYERGSEWRRWDLHIHTPGTLKNDQYEGKTIEEKWDNFYDTIAQYIGDGTDPLRTIEVILILFIPIVWKADFLVNLSFHLAEVHTVLYMMN